MQQRSHADRLAQSPRRGMFDPRASHVARRADGTPRPAVVPHVEHQHARSGLGNLRLGRIGPRMSVGMPRRAVVEAVHHTGVGHPRRVDILNRKDERPVAHRDAAARTLQRKVPVGLLDLPRQVPRFGPRPAVIAAAGEHQLGRLDRFVTVPHGRPGPVVAQSVGPCRHDEDLTRAVIDQYRGIADAVLRLGKTAPTPHVHDNPHRLPRTASVRAAAQTDVNIFLQVEACAVAHVIDPQQRACRGGDQPRDAVGIDAVIAVLADSHTPPVGRVARRGELDAPAIDQDPGDLERKGPRKLLYPLDVALDTHIEIVAALDQLLSRAERKASVGTRGGRRLLDGIVRIGIEPLSSAQPPELVPHGIGGRAREQGRHGARVEKPHGAHLRCRHAAQAHLDRIEPGRDQAVVLDAAFGHDVVRAAQDHRDTGIVDLRTLHVSPCRQDTEAPRQQQRHASDMLEPNFHSVTYPSFCFTLLSFDSTPASIGQTSLSSLPPTSSRAYLPPSMRRTSYQRLPSATNSASRSARIASSAASCR